MRKHAAVADADAIDEQMPDKGVGDRAEERVNPDCRRRCQVLDFKGIVTL